MPYLLDANAVITLLNDPKSKLAQRAERENPGEIAISAIVSHELYFGAFKSARATKNLAVIDALQFTVIDFTTQDARASGEVRAYLSSKGSPIGPYDVLIAGQALSRSLVLVTHNAREFGRVPKLKIEDWQK